ncbi:TPA: hypothetical protein K8M77_000316 [Clostridium perfringens]|nr:hypothetical protein [Clostridium perfringens]
MDIKNFEKTMTVFFSKSTGKIKALCQGVQGFNFFGDEAVDMELILDRLVTDYNPKVMSNMDFYVVKEGKIEVNASVLEQFKL